MYNIYTFPKDWKSTKVYLVNPIILGYLGDEMKSKILTILYRCSFILILQFTTLLYAVFNRYTGNEHNMVTFIDNIIPFVKEFIVPYHFWSFYVISALVYLAIVNGKNYFRLLTSIVVGKVICFTVYYFYPTTVPRPEVVGNDFFAQSVLTTYAKDNPYNCFPSIHVMSALLVCIFLVKQSKNIYTKVYAVTVCILITLSTMFVKQHYFFDVVSAVILGLIMYNVVINEKVWNKKLVVKLKPIFRPSKVKENYVDLE